MMNPNRSTFFAFMAAVALVVLVGCESTLDPVDHGAAFGMEIVASDGTVLAAVNASRQVTGALSVGAGEERGLTVYFLDSQGVRFQPEADDDDPSIGWEIADESVAEIELHEGHHDLVGKAVGETTVVFALLHEGHSDYESPAIPIQVTGVE